MDNFMSNHIFCWIRRDSESALLLIGTFKQFCVLKWFSGWDLDSTAALASRYSVVRMQPLYMWLHETQKSALNQPNHSWFQYHFPFVGWKKWFCCNVTVWKKKKPVVALPATQLLTKCRILNQLSHVNISCSQVYQDMSGSVWVAPCLLHIQLMWSLSLAHHKVRKEKLLQTDTSEAQRRWTLHCGYQLWMESKSENVPYSAM